MAFLVNEYNRSVPRPLELEVLHVALDAGGETEGLPASVRRWLSSRGLDVIEVGPRLEASQELPLGCFACARARRRSLLEAAEARGMTHVALGHHADDVVETWLMSLMYTGTAEVLPPIRSYFDGAVQLVRPLYELKRGELARLARLAEAPQLEASCPADTETKRELVRAALRALGRDQALVRRQLYWAAVRQADQLETEGNDAGGECRYG
jgi:tRNA(Ile)-lysidine synthase TilS/MesJ